MRWNYDRSVTKMRPRVIKWKTLTENMLTELRTARKELSNQGVRSDLTSAQTVRSWEGYLRDIGLAKSTVNRWLRGNIHFLRKGTNEWGTPGGIIKTVQSVLSIIDLDPCSGLEKSIPARKHYTVEED